MTSTVPAALLVVQYLFWEVAVSALALVALVRVGSPPLKLALLIGLNLSLSALSAALLSFLGLNSPAAYLVIAAIFSTAAIAMGWTRRNDLAIWTVRHGPETFALWFALGVMLSLSIRPIEEVDSLYNLHYAMGWVRNLTTPYQFAYNYPSFWELSFVPGLTLTHSDLFLWYNSLKPILLLAVILYLIARELELPSRLAIWTIPALLLFPSLWLGPSGVSTIKTDMLHAAGYALAALVVVRAAQGKSEAVDVALASLAAAFVSVKFSGPVTLLATALIVAVAARGWIARNLGTAGLALGAVAAFWFVIAGHYYLHNFLVYGSPVYPYQINLGPIHLPGRADLSGTSILYSLNDARLWRYFFLPDRGLSPAGVLFPLILPAILIGSAVVAGIAASRRRIDALAALALFELVSWAVYFRSYYSASAAPGDLAFVVNDLNSLRYVEGPLLVGELCLVWALYRIRAPRPLIFLLLAAQAASSLAISLHRAPDQPWLLAALCGFALALLSLALGRRMLLPAAAALCAASLFAGTYLIERRRPLWMPPLQPLYLPLYEAPAQDLFYLIDDEFSQQPCRHFAFLGARLQHTADSGLLSSLISRPTPPRYVAWTRATPDAPPPVLPGYTVAASAPMGMLFERR